MAVPAPPLAKIYEEAKAAAKEDPNKAPLGTLSSVEDLVNRYRGDPTAVKVGIYAAIMESVAVCAALSMIPFTANFASHYAGMVLRDIANAGVSGAITEPIRDYMENIFPTREISPFMLIRGMERGALTDEEIIDTGIDAGYKDKEIVKLLKIGKVLRFERETDQDYAMLDRYQNALISYQITAGRADIDEAISVRNARIKELEAMIRAGS